MGSQSEATGRQLGYCFPGWSWSVLSMCHTNARCCIHGIHKAQSL